MRGEARGGRGRCQATPSPLGEQLPRREERGGRKGFHQAARSALRGRARRARTDARAHEIELDARGAARVRLALQLERALRLGGQQRVGGGVDFGGGSGGGGGFGFGRGVKVGARSPRRVLREFGPEQFLRGETRVPSVWGKLGSEFRTSTRGAKQPCALVRKRKRELRGRRRDKRAARRAPRDDAREQRRNPSDPTPTHALNLSAILSRSAVHVVANAIVSGKMALSIAWNEARGRAGGGTAPRPLRGDGRGR